MVVFKPEPVVLEDEKSKSVMYNFIVMDQASFLDWLSTWMEGDPARLAVFLDELDVAGLCIARKVRSKS